MNLKEDFSYQTIDLKDDYEGKAIAVLSVSNHNKGNRSAVLYIHGYIDYFFHPHVGEKFIENNFDFYALDLRKHGRSLLPHQHPNFCISIEEYFEEISHAILQISEQNTSVYLLAHSTGGLTASNYMNFGKERHLVKGLILNSPFLDLNLSPMEKIGSKLLAKIASKISLYSKIEGALSPAYAQSIHKDYYGEWDFDIAWKPIKGFPTYFNWLNAIVIGQKKLQSSNIAVPILILHSSGSARLKKYSSKAMENDIVLNIEDIKRVGKQLGPMVTLTMIDGAVHDVFLSREHIRNTAFKELFSWLKKMP